MEVILKTGTESKRALSIPSRNLMGVYAPGGTGACEAIAVQLERALVSPIGRQPLKEYATGKSKCLIIIDDLTRTTPVSDILPLVMQHLEQAGLDCESICILVALGTHRPMTEAEIRRRVGRDIHERVRVINHDWRDDESFVTLGSTSCGIPVRANRMIKDFDLSIGIGQVNPHRVTGFSGGGKIILPGIADERSTGLLHWESARYAVEEILGRLLNPILDQVNDAAAMAGLDYLVNVVQAADGCVVFAGEPASVYKEAAKAAEKVFGAELPGTADVVVFNSYPCDIDFWQAAKALYAAGVAVRPGGTLLMQTGCAEGISAVHGETMVLHGCRPFRDMEKLVRDGEIEDLVVAAVMALIAEITRDRARTVIVSDYLKEEEVRALGCVQGTNLQAELDRCLSESPSAQVAVLQEACKLLPRIGH